MGESFLCPGSPQLGIGEGEPDLFHFTRLEISGETIDLGTEKGGIGDIFLETFFSADVNTITFQVHAQEIAPGIHSGQSDGVFAFAAGQLEGQRVVILKKFRPLSCHAFGVLKNIGKGLYRGESDQLFLAHLAKVKIV